MTDNEVIYAFSEGCALLQNNDVDSEDLASIRKHLDECAHLLMPFVYKYKDTYKWCTKCKNQCGKTYIQCEYEDDCFYSFNRPHFKKKNKEK